MPISRHSICQSPRKLWATSDHASTEVRRRRQASSELAGVVLVAGVGGGRVLTRAGLEPGG